MGFRNLSPKFNPVNNLIIRPLDLEFERIPYPLLLLADPHLALINTYLPQSNIHIALLAEKIVGVYVLYPLDHEKVEVKNIAVAEEHQGYGLGKLLLADACLVAKQQGYHVICIGTANSSIGQLALYQKQGFELSEIKRDFFLQNYAEPIFENGIQAKHMVVLEKIL